MSSIRHVAFTGAPGVGKDTAADYLARRYNAVRVDDGRHLREIAKLLFGLGEEEVSTHAGKARMTVVCGKTWENRKILGEIGNKLEELFGQHVIPECAVRAFADPDRLNVYSSVRKTQGDYYRAHGGIVIEIAREGYIATNGFDFTYAEADYRILNVEGRPSALYRQLDDIMAKYGVQSAPEAA